MALPQGRPNRDAMENRDAKDGGMDGGMDRWTSCMHGAANDVPPGRKHVNLVGIPRAFQ